MENAKFYDAIIIGAGPAGLTSAIYLARAGYGVLVIEKEKIGGQITITSEVVNYPGVMRTDGYALTDTMYRQAKAFGADFVSATVSEISASDNKKRVSTSVGAFACTGIIIATGARPKSLGFPGEEEFRGHGVAYCATCDGEFFDKKEIFVIGGGFSAAEESIFLTRYASRVTVLVRGHDFSCAQSAARAVYDHPKIRVLTDTEIVSLHGDTLPRRIVYRNRISGEVTGYSPENGDAFGVFVFVGYEPESGLLKNLAKIDEQGYIITDEHLMTSADGIFAAGDVRKKVLRQVVTAVGDGATAATELEKYISATGGDAARSGMRKDDAGGKPPAPQDGGRDSDSVFPAEIREQLALLFEKIDRKIIFELYRSPDRSDKRSSELEKYLRGLCGICGMFSIEYADGKDGEYLPAVRILGEDRSYSGLAFHGIPGGHEFSSFAVGICNAAGVGQPISDDLRQKIEELKTPLGMKVLVSLGCTNCPALVIAAQQIAALRDGVSAEVYDVTLYPELREKYNVMSVPCLVINDSRVSFGRRGLDELLEYIGEQS